ncbi:hypothetical protein ElyMa_001050600 [Elysia marginata]|uniref:EGF-like domain-containing protein n=1 Tax=Elysia marginata TaxID=1093978 RepID=A0AAV4HQ02_9GAST|nr:hypothetical protein ElyMa_001050600 [Elysia marginata]
MHLPSLRLILSTLLAYVIHCIEGSSRTPTLSELSATTPSPGGGRPTTTSTIRSAGKSGGQFECTPAEVKKAACLHGGKCFAVELFGPRTGPWQQHILLCCPKTWFGKCCQWAHYTFNDFFAHYGIPGGLVGAVAFVGTIVGVRLLMKKRITSLKSNGKAQMYDHCW